MQGSAMADTRSHVCGQAALTSAGRRVVHEAVSQRPLGDARQPTSVSGASV